jgi:hypothetical protein
MCPNISDHHCMPLHGEVSQYYNKKIARVCFFSGDITRVVFFGFPGQENHECDISTQKTHECHFLFIT